MGLAIYSSLSPIQEQIAGVVIVARVTVPDCLGAVLPKIVGSCSILPGPFNVFLLAPGTHNHRSLATFLILKKEKLIITPCIIQLAVRIFCVKRHF